MNKKDKGKRVLITGCSSGFGLLTTVAAAKAGYECIATMRNLAKAEPLKQALQRQNVTATIDRLDVTDTQTIAEITAKYAPVDILINNAGILIGGSCLDITEDEMRRIFETNYFGAVALTRAILPQMIAQGGGLIINVASLAGLIGHMFNATYAASKHALVGFSQSIRTELKPFNIKVVSVEPGYHKTEMIRSNANLSENFYNRESPMFKYNQGFLRLMFNEVVPRAGDPGNVADKLVEIISAENPKPHYVIGKDARFATIAKWLGLMGVLEKKAYAKLLKETARSVRKDLTRRERTKT